MGEHYKTNKFEYSILTTKRLWRNPQSFLYLMTYNKFRKNIIYNNKDR